MPSRYFEGAGEKPQRPHVLAGGGRGREIRDLRADTEAAFARVEGVTDLILPVDAGVWDDLQGSIDDGQGGASLTTEAYRDTQLDLQFWRYDQADHLQQAYQLPHDWVVGSQIRPHVHVIPCADPGVTQIFAVKGYYTWARVNYELPALSGWTAFTAQMNVAPGDVFLEKVLSLPGLLTPPSWVNRSSSFLITMERDIAVDTYETAKVGGTSFANIALLHADVHYQKNTFGSATEIPTEG